MKQNYRGVRPASLVTVLEGDGTKNNPYKNVDYVLVTEILSGMTRQITLGKVVEMTQQEKDAF